MSVNAFRTSAKEEVSASTQRVPSCAHVPLVCLWIVQDKDVLVSIRNCINQCFFSNGAIQHAGVPQER